MIRFLLTLAFTIFLAGCCTQQCGTSTLAQIQELSSNCTGAGSVSSINNIRQQALQETAMSIGAQSGLAYRAKQINAMTQQNSASLDRIFNFNLMMLPHNVLPPVLEQGNSSLNLDDDQTIRISDRTYQIVSQARFVTTPPNWRDYLWLTYTVPEVPYGTLLPQNCNERKIWRTYAAIGWQQGIDQANEIYATNLARLKRDFTGMILYRVLLIQGMVSPPYVARTELGVTGSCSDMRINDQVLRITALPCLQTNSKLWRPAIDP